MTHKVGKKGTLPKGTGRWPVTKFTFAKCRTCRALVQADELTLRNDSRIRNTYSICRGLHFCSEACCKAWDHVGGQTLKGERWKELVG